MPNHQTPINILEDNNFRTFIDAAPDAIVVVDKNGVIVFINELTEKIFGHSSDELLGQKVEILMPAKYQKEHINHRTNYFKAPRTRRMGEGKELFGRRKDGSEFSIEISLSPIITPDQAFVMSIIRDISVRKSMETLFKGLLESAPDGIVVINSQGIIQLVNGQTEKLFGHKKEELIGKPIEILVPDGHKESHVAKRNNYINNPHTRPMGAGLSLTGQKKDGSTFPVEVSLSPLQIHDGVLITSIIRDVTDRTKVQNQISDSLKEKEALLKEIHHRVKNNLQITSSLLNLQSDYIHDPESKELFIEGQNRIRSMALIHEKLYKAKDLSNINFSEYIKSLASLLSRTYYDHSKKIKIDIDESDINLSINTAVPCGLICNELITNSLKHAFPDGRSGRIHFSCQANDHEIAIILEDNGHPKSS